MAKYIELNISRAELWAHRNNVEHLICREMRRHGIPVKGLLRYKGLKHGVMSLKRNQDGSASFKWWRNAEDALDDGVVVPESPESKAKQEAEEGVTKLEL